MTYDAIGRKVGGNMIRVCCRVKIRQMTSHAGIWGVDIIPLMTDIAIVGNGSMCASERINIGVIEYRWIPCGL